MTSSYSNNPVLPQVVSPVPMNMNWSYFKPEFSGKLDEDPEAHLLGTVHWMDMQIFAADQRVRTFPLTLAGEARLWNQTTHPFQDNWEDLQERLKTEFYKICNARKQLFDAWRSFYYDENAGVIGIYVHKNGK